MRAREHSLVGVKLLDPALGKRSVVVASLTSLRRLRLLLLLILRLASRLALVLLLLRIATARGRPSARGCCC